MSDFILSTAPAEPQPFRDALIRLSDVETVAGLRRSHVYKLIADGEFPRPIKIGTASRWSVQEIQAWVAGKLAERDAVRGTIG